MINWLEASTSLSLEPTIATDELRLAFNAAYQIRHF